MSFRLIDNQEEWDGFVASQPFSQFLQSWSWGEFQKQYGRRVWRVGIFDSDQISGAAQIIEHYLGLGLGYLYCPRGPLYHVIASPDTKLVNFIQEKIANYGTIFLRVEPSNNIQYPISPPKADPPWADNIQCFHVPSVQPAHTLMLDLSLSEDELLVAMHPKTRYNIHLAERKGLETRIANRELRTEFDAFWNLMRETAKRDRIKLHPKKYYQIMSQILGRGQSAIKYLIFNIQYLNILLAGGIFIGFGDTFTYVHGASSSQHREMMAPHLLHWQAIKFAKKAGYRYYDFGGVNPNGKNDFNYRPNWEGITRFKKGFASEASPDRSPDVKSGFRSGHRNVGSGFIQSYIGTDDVVLNKRGYNFYQLAKKIKSLLP